MRPSICPTGSIEAMLQSERPTAESANGPLSGDVIAARASVIVRDRSAPNHGLARPPATDLRVVATRSVGWFTSPEAPKRGPFAAKPAQPPAASAVAADARPRSAVRRETAVRSGSMRQSFSRLVRSAREDAHGVVCRPIAAIAGHGPAKRNRQLEVAG